MTTGHAYQSQPPPLTDPEPLATHPASDLEEGSPV